MGRGVNVVRSGAARGYRMDGWMAGNIGGRRKTVKGEGHSRQMEQRQFGMIISLAYTSGDLFTYLAVSRRREDGFQVEPRRSSRL